MSDSETNVVSIIEQYRKAKAPNEPAKAPEQPPPEAAPREYKAYGVDAPRKKPSLMSIHYGGGQVGMMQKSYLTEVLLTSHQHLSLIFTNCIITLEGQHLDQLLELFQDETILSLHCFSPKLHDRPPEGEPVITRIERRGANEIAAIRK